LGQPLGDLATDMLHEVWKRKKVTDMLPNSDLCRPHPNFDSAINRAIFESEIEGGVALDDLPVGAWIEVETTNHVYEVENRGDGKVLIAGHPEYCPRPVLVDLHGSTLGNQMIKMRFIGRGMKMEFRHPTFGVIRTGRVQEIRERKPVPRADVQIEREAC
jgi:hypothetical protein